MPKPFPEELKQQCIDAVLKEGKSRAEVAKEFGVSSSALGRWVSRAQGTEGKGSGWHRKPADISSMDATEMQKRIDELEMENEFLRAANGFFAQMQKER